MIRTRREILGDGAALVVALAIPRCAASTERSKGSELAPNAWIRIGTDDRITFILDRVEMGQGVATSHAALIADELGVELGDLEIEPAVADRKYDNPVLGTQVTGGSTSTVGSWDPLRRAGAEAREALRSAAARIWGVDPKDCVLERKRFVHRATGRRLSFGECVAEARDLVRAAEPIDPAARRLVGRSVPRVDAKDKSTGAARYGIDVRIPGMLTAYLIRGPVVGARVKSLDHAEAEKLEGVHRIVRIGEVVAVVADSYWRAKKAAERVRIDHEPVDLSTASIEAAFRERAEEEGKVAVRRGWFDKAFSGAKHRVQAVYRFPYLAHATMEPQNATAHVRPDRCDVWAPTQVPGAARKLAAEITGLDESAVEVRTTLLGGGFGRRLAADYVGEAVLLSKTLGQPVQVLWSREDDLGHDVYRGGSFHLAQAGIADGTIAGWSHRIVGPSIIARTRDEAVASVLPDWVPSGVAKAAGSVARSLMEGPVVDPSSVEGALPPYAIDDLRIEYAWCDPGVPIGYWRSVGHSYNAFVVETMIDEVAFVLERDPIDFRRERLPEGRLRRVLDLAAEKAGWRAPAPGRHRGVAAIECYGSAIAQVAEVSVERGSIRVHRVVAAIDCGLAVNPDIVRAQVESAVVFGLSAALFGRIDFDAGFAVQSNFHDYRVLRMNEMPAVEVHVVESDAPPAGVGEVGVPPIAPAVANAVFRATGRRLRALPLDPDRATSPPG
jgi:CO/xanthine dehydrogenase Mo-binding subunit